MAKSITVDRKPGRPATGHDPAISVRVPQYFIDQADAFAKTAKISRAEAFRKLIEMGIDGLPKPKQKSKALKVAVTAEITKLLAPHRLRSKPKPKPKR